MDSGRRWLNRGGRADASGGSAAGGEGVPGPDQNRGLAGPEPAARQSSAAHLDDDELAGDLMARIGEVIDEWAEKHRIPPNIAFQQALSYLNAFAATAKIKKRND